MVRVKICPGDMRRNPFWYYLTPNPNSLSLFPFPATPSTVAPLQASSRSLFNHEPSKKQPPWTCL